MTTPDIHDLTGPYVLDAATDDERIAFERHLARCAACSIELMDLREAVTRLSRSVALAPPSELKPRVLTMANQTRQLFPVPRVEAPVARRPLRRALTLAAALVAVAASGGVAIDQYRSNAETTAVSAQAASILAEPDTRTVRGAVTGGGQATLMVSSSRDAAVVLLRDLPPLDHGRTYQLWLVDDANTARSIGLTSGGSTRPTIVTGGVSGQTDFAVTVEPRGGSDHPTLPPAGGLEPAVHLDLP
ncbi:anti-sigma factor [Kribbella sp. DT2]|uniref:anti-sigma factor n=1 Tax=Kribbella sp. DT2 TaxID=3393427 RepID=UPI003CED36B5